jgi:hypothetical protein
MVSCSSSSCVCTYSLYLSGYFFAFIIKIRRAPEGTGSFYVDRPLRLYLCKSLLILLAVHLYNFIETIRELLVLLSPVLLVVELNLIEKMCSRCCSWNFHSKNNLQQFSEYVTSGLSGSVKQKLRIRVLIRPILRILC